MVSQQGDALIWEMQVKAFQSITRKISQADPKDNYACNTLAIKSARKLCVPRFGSYTLNFDRQVPSPDYSMGLGVIAA
jgi:hypothetical protein